MKILIVDELCYPQLGGIQVRFKALAQEWVKLGHSVTITAIDHLGTSPLVEEIDGVVYNRIIKDSGYYKSGLFGRKISTIIKYTIKLNPYLKYKYDLIIFCQFPMLPQIFYKIFYKKRSNTVLDFVEHRDSKLWRIINNIIINAADKVVCVSDHVKKCAFMYRKNELFVMPSFVDTKTSISKSKSTYVFLGRMEEHKHPELAIEAVASYNKTYQKNAVLDMVGDGSLLGNLKEKYARFPFINFWGSVSEEKKKEILSNGRLLVLPSEREGLPIVVIEAMSYGVPTITTEYPGNGTKFFVVDEKIGKVAIPDALSIAKEIDAMEKDYQCFVDRCNLIKANYDIELIGRNYLSIFN